MAMKPNTINVIQLLKQNKDQNLTAAQVAELLGLEKRVVDGIFTSAIQRKDWGFREESEVENEDGTHAKVKYLRLNDKGMAVDLTAEAQA